MLRISNDITQESSWYIYNGNGSLTARLDSSQAEDKLIGKEEFAYNVMGTVAQYKKYNVPGPNYKEYKLDECYSESIDGEKWDWRYSYTPLGGREQKRLLKSPHGDECGICFHPWVYYLRGAYGEQLAVYHGKQTAEKDDCGNEGRRVHFYPTEYLTNSGELTTLPNGTKEFAIADNLGSVRAVVSTTGTIRSIDYEPFGETLEATNSEVRRVGFTGNEMDFESRYFAFGARLYDAKTGRFQQADPLLELFPTQSSYSYAFNSPLNFRDPSGLKPEKAKGDKMQAGVLEEIGNTAKTVWNFFKSLFCGTDGTPIEPGRDPLFGWGDGGGRTGEGSGNETRSDNVAGIGGHRGPAGSGLQIQNNKNNKSNKNQSNTKNSQDESSIIWGSILIVGPEAEIKDLESILNTSGNCAELNNMLQNINCYLEQNGQTCILSYFDENDLPVGTAFYPYSIDGFDPPIVGLSREILFTGDKPPYQYNTLEGNYSLFGLGLLNFDDLELADESKERAVFHELGHLLQRLLEGMNYYNLSWNEKESFSIYYENVAGAFFGQPKRRVTYNKQLGDFYFTIFGSDIDIFYNPIKKYGL